MLALVPIPLAVIAAIVFSAGSIGFVYSSIFAITAIISAIYSIYLNQRTNVYFWDWKNYISIISSAVLGALALIWTIIIMSFDWLG